MKKFNLNSIKIYPNPVSELLHIQKTNNALFLFEMFDASGNLVWSGNIEDESTSINLNHLNQGVYFYCLYDIYLNINQTGKINILR